MHENTLPRLPSRMTILGSVFIVAIATFLVYVSSLHNGFIALDDPYVIYNNLAIRAINPGTIYAIFSRFDPELYIPLTFFSFQIDYLLGGLNAFQFHLTNLVLHIGNSLFVLWIAFALLRNRLAALFCALLFALHPVNVEVVTWATARKETLSVFFTLGSIVAYLYGTADAKRWAYWVGILLFGLALLSKVTVFTLPALLLLMDWYRGRRIGKAALIDKIPYALLSAIFVLVGLIPKLQILSSTTTFEKILMAARSTMFYLEKLLLPVNLSVLYPNSEAITLSSPGFAISMTLFVLLACCVALSLKRTRKIAFGFGFFLLAISPTFVHFNRNAAIQSASGGGIQIASDHYVYLPMLGLVLMVGAGIAWLLNRSTETKGTIRELIIGAASCVIVAFGILAMLQSHVWKSSETLFAHTLKHYPESVASRVNLSVIYRKSNRFDEEKSVLEDGLVYGPNSKLETGMAAIAARNGDTQTAMTWYQKAIDHDPTNAEPYFGMAVMAKDPVESERLYFRAIELDPQYVAAYVNLASLLIGQERYEEAEHALLTATSLNESSLEAFFNLGALYGATGNTDEAIAAFEHVLLIDPDFTQAKQQIELLRQSGN